MPAPLFLSPILKHFFKFPHFQSEKPKPQFCNLWNWWNRDYQFLKASVSISRLHDSFLLAVLFNHRKFLIHLTCHTFILYLPFLMVLCADTRSRNTKQHKGHPPPHLTHVPQKSANVSIFSHNQKDTFSTFGRYFSKIPGMFVSDRNQKGMHW